jgi:hypothetical protein
VGEKNYILIFINLTEIHHFFQLWI